MATLDVSEAILAPEFTTTFTVKQRAENVNNYGESVVVPVTINNVSGVVCAAGPHDLERLDDHQRMGKVISVVTKFRLTGPGKEPGGQQRQPDIIVWRNSQFVVHLLDDNTHFGSGFVQALCGSIDSVDRVPA